MHVNLVSLSHKPLGKVMRFYVGSDHGGVEMREQLTGLLREWGHEVADVFGPISSGESVDYPDIAEKVCLAVITSDKIAHGLLICGTGQGMAISANKLRGIRAAAVGDAFSARMIREHNNANVICLGQRVLGSELAALILQTYVESEFAGGRHENRVAKISALEK